MMGFYLTAEEFERRYAADSNIPVAQLRDAGRVVKPCTCGEPGCEGWQSVNEVDWLEDEAMRRASS